MITKFTTRYYISTMCLIDSGNDFYSRRSALNDGVNRTRCKSVVRFNTQLKENETFNFLPAMKIKPLGGTFWQQKQL